MKKQKRFVQCSAPDCMRTFATSSRNPVLYCETCRKEQLRKARRRYEKCKRIRPYELIEEIPADLYEKLDSAEFSIIFDAGPQDCSFRPGAILSAWDVHYMLKYKSIAENSVLLHSQTKVEHRVIRVPRGGLRLDPPWD